MVFNYTCVWPCACVWLVKCHPVHSTPEQKRCFSLVSVKHTITPPAISSACRWEIIYTCTVVLLAACSIQGQGQQKWLCRVTTVPANRSRPLPLWTAEQWMQQEYTHNYKLNTIVLFIILFIWFCIETMEHNKLTINMYLYYKRDMADHALLECNVSCKF